MDEVKDLSMVDNTIAMEHRIIDENIKSELLDKGIRPIVLETDPKEMTTAIKTDGGKFSINKTLFAHKFQELFTIYAHNSLGGQWFYDEKTGLWNDLDMETKSFGSGIYQQLVKPMYYNLLLSVDSDGQLAKKLEEGAQEIANASLAYGIGTGLGQYKNDGLVLFNDGRVYDFDLEGIRKAKKEDYMTKRFEYPIVENEDGGAIKEWLDFVLQDSAKAFYEYIGSSFIQRPIYNVFAFAVNGLVSEDMKSNGGNGKSEVLNFLSDTLFGKDNSETLSLDDLLQGEDKKIINLHQKFLNIDSETSEHFINDTAKLKKLTGGESRSIDRKYKTSIQLKNSAKLLFATNNVPTFRDDSSAFQRRLMIIPFNRDFKGKDAEEGRKWYTKELQELRKSPEELGKFAYYCIKQFQELFKEKGYSANNPFSMSKTALRLRDETIENNNPAKSFISNCVMLEFTNNDDDMITQGILYDMYTAFTKNDSVKPVSKANFKKYLADYIANNDKPVANTSDRKFNVKVARAYKGIRLVQGECDSNADQAAKNVLIDKYKSSDYVNIFDVLPIGGEN